MIGRRTGRGRRGFTMTHLMLTLMLLGAFTVVASRVFRLSLQTSQGAARANERDLRLEQALHTLRADVWEARSFDRVEPTALTIATPDGLVQWQTTAEGELIRKAGGRGSAGAGSPAAGDSGSREGLPNREDTRQWADLGLRFRRQGSAVLLTHDESVVAVLQQGAPQ